MQQKYRHILVLGLILLSIRSVAQQKNTIKLLTPQIEYVVGNTIILKFSAKETLKPLLYCSSSYGSTLISPNIKDNTLWYTIPQTISKKRSLVHWKILDDHASISGTFNITPKQEVATMETYIGPPSIEAGGTDYTMLVVIPTDSLDNPLAENTLIKAKHQFLTSEESNDIFTKNLISYINIFSKKESGRMLVSSESLNVNSKEFTINITPAISTDFTISAKRPHNYADGNQITTFSTSVIKDKHNNVVSDGTFVTFFITNKDGHILKTTGTVIKGIAYAKMIHPEFEDHWSIKAYIEGIAESKPITLTYKQVIDDFNVTFSEKNRKIKVGPLKSFMLQMIPDGLQVKLHIYKNQLLINTITKTTYNGYTNFNLKPEIFENGNYDIKIQTAGKIKEFNTKKLW